jgi:ferrous iron transport protein A
MPSSSLANAFDPSAIVPLQFLLPGQRAEVDEVVGGTEEVHRLEELGVRRGAEIEMLQAGSPCIIRLAGSKLCFRETDLLNVLVRLGTAS